MHPTPCICDRMLGLNMYEAELWMLRQELATQVLLLKQHQEELEKLASNCINITAMLSLKTMVRGSGTSPD